MGIGILRWVAFALAVGLCAAFGQSITLHYWRDAIGNAIGAALFFAIYFAFTSRRMRTGDGSPAHREVSP